MKQGWQTNALGEVCDVIGGGTPSKNNAAFYAGNIPWATVRDMRHEVITETECCITKEAVRSSATNVIPANNVVIATRVGLGKVCLLGQDTAINQDLRALIPRDNKTVSVRFLFWWLKTMADTIIAEGTGATVQGVKLPFIKSLQLPVPPLADQRRVVRILDEAFAELATVKANTEKNLQNARAVFESRLETVFAEGGEGWEEVTVGDVCDIKHGFAFDGADFSSNVPDGSPLIITPGNFTEDGRLLFNEKNTKRFSGSPPPGLSFEIDDLVVVMTDLSSKMKILGKPAFIDRPNVLHNQRIGRVILKTDDINKRILYYFMRTRRFSENIKDTSTGTMVRHTAPRRILANSFLYPKKLKEQKAVVAKLDNLEAETSRLAHLYQKKLSALEDLRKSVLHKAFSGQL